MESEKDIFSEGWGDEGVVADERAAEELPEEEAPEEEDAGTEVPESAPPANGRRDEGEVRRFVRAFPEVRGEDIPREVWERVREGESLTEAFLGWETRRLREENERLRRAGDQRERNAARSAGSQMGQGAGGTRLDAFDDGWEMR